MGRWVVGKAACHSTMVRGSAYLYGFIRVSSARAAVRRFCFSCISELAGEKNSLQCWSARRQFFDCASCVHFAFIANSSVHKIVN